MKIEINVPDLRNFIKDIPEKRERFFQLIRYDLRKSVGKYLTELMKEELTGFLDWEYYERKSGKKNSRNGTYKRGYTLKEPEKFRPMCHEVLFKNCIVTDSIITLSITEIKHQTFCQVFACMRLNCPYSIIHHEYEHKHSNNCLNPLFRQFKQVIHVQVRSKMVCQFSILLISKFCD